MARITVEDCLESIGENKRFDLVHLTVERIRQHRHGEPYLVAGKNKEVVMTLREVAAKKVTFENIRNLPDAVNEAVTEEVEVENTEEEKAAV
ncbi:DNA-directed RNA polymerase subunit omega [Desulfocapsa sulfexigens DSM 10523]|uniref:DNA-directed RNA polymerase subunit omega n=1 Tax=Desulfocapsa sulfexigens (strain DSM 10523 / SB164P1) TaxID=1167006 RepID=M1PGT9_DESSD|nr:DNA-directed RNA polymerase subunit omega [Desulfocapsa sulfexigens]AGF78850.1 DNA-directed RNA polymerase subunit omega [Desulfocapsa sulfexigens DSM 10523]